MNDDDDDGTYVRRVKEDATALLLQGRGRPRARSSENETRQTYLAYDSCQGIAISSLWLSAVAKSGLVK